uniref:Protein kinase domain-containing protein n=1 Tax=Hyaloperonospora arabidopsidis (strain Emoy2) TaxID=559515 RepID=M4BTX5_HYAAE
MFVAQRVAAGKLYPTIRAGCNQASMDLVERCLLADPSERPTAPAIAYELRVIQQDILLK